MSVNLHIPEILLADDDIDDCSLFSDALEESQLAAHLTVARDGQQVIDLLNKSEQLPDILFLDLNMPRRNGFECLNDIRHNQRFEGLPVIIVSTSYDEDVINIVYAKGAQYYINKPNDYRQLVKVIRHAVVSIMETPPGRRKLQPNRDNFVLSAATVLQ